MIHTIFRKNALNVSATLRSSNISTTLWADYEFLKILSYYIAEELGVENLPIKLTVNIRSAHIVP
jgi:thymidylate synthase